MSIRFTKDHIFAIFALIASIAGLIGSIGQVYFDFQKKEDNLVYEKQIDSLNEVVKNIDTLRAFVVQQKESLTISQQSLAELKKKQDILKPVVEADQKTIDAIFALQEENNRKNVWWERAIGFFLGIAGSLIASLIWAYTRKKT